MTSFPNTNFPLLAGDQADVIRIFLELMSERNDAERAAQFTAKRSRRSLKDFNQAPDKAELTDLE